jgi:CHAT domain-containing protein
MRACQGTCKKGKRKVNWITLLPAYRDLAKQNDLLQRENVLLRDAISKANLDIARCSIQSAMLKKELHTVEQDVEQYVDENAALKKQVEVLVQAAKQPVPSMENVLRENKALASMIKDLTEQLRATRTVSNDEHEQKAAKQPAPIPSRPVRQTKKAKADDPDRMHSYPKLD